MSDLDVYMGVDQYGQTYHGLTHPRKDLCQRLGRKHADIMYRGDGEIAGYVVAGLWIDVYKVMPFKDHD